MPSSPTTVELSPLTDALIGACAQDPDRWIDATDDATKAICRACPRRWQCAREACEMPDVEGVWAGIHVPESGRGRSHAMRQLRRLAELAGNAPRR